MSRPLAGLQRKTLKREKTSVAVKNLDLCNAARTLLLSRTPAIRDKPVDPYFSSLRLQS
jgi:hypothetical protein